MKQLKFASILKRYIQKAGLRSLALVVFVYLLSTSSVPATADQPEASQSVQASEHQTSAQIQPAKLAEELNSIVRQHDDDGNEKKLFEAIVTRLLSSNGDSEPLELVDEASMHPIDGLPDALDMAADMQQLNPDGLRLRKLLSSIAEDTGSQAFRPFPMLPSSQAATMKRAIKVGSYLKQHPRLGDYGRNAFDFGLGKRPDSTGGNVLRFGDSLLLNSVGPVQPVGQLGKRPSAHRYDFGLGKRVASPTYPRYDFGLGKRAPSRIRYDFGLGK